LGQRRHNILLVVVVELVLEQRLWLSVMWEELVEVVLVAMGSMCQIEQDRTQHGQFRQQVVVVVVP
jgi:hypothetical protein